MTKSNIEPLVDELGQVQAQIAELARKEKTLKAQLAEAGEGSYEGELFRVTVSTYDRHTLDSNAARAKLEELEVSHQWFTAHTKTTSVTVVRVSAKIEGRAAA